MPYLRDWVHDHGDLEVGFDTGVVKELGRLKSLRLGLTNSSQRVGGCESQERGRSRLR